jgi:hypothetical protein
MMPLYPGCVSGNSSNVANASHQTSRRNDRQQASRIQTKVL